MKRNRTVKSIFPVIAAFVLFGLANCMFIEPVAALSHQETECADEAGHCCFICNPSQHEWNLFSGADFVQPAEVTTSLVSIRLQIYTYVTPASIDHPPPVSLRI